MHIQIYMFIYLYVYTYVYVCMHIYIYRRTHSRNRHHTMGTKSSFGYQSSFLHCPYLCLCSRFFFVMTRHVFFTSLLLDCETTLVSWVAELIFQLLIVMLVIVFYFLVTRFTHPLDCCWTVRSPSCRGWQNYFCNCLCFCLC